MNALCIISIFFKGSLFYFGVCNCSVRICHLNTYTLGVEEVSDSLEPELKLVVSHLLYVREVTAVNQ